MRDKDRERSSQTETGSPEDELTESTVLAGYTESTQTEQVPEVPQGEQVFQVEQKIITVQEEESSQTGVQVEAGSEISTEIRGEPEEEGTVVSPVSQVLEEAVLQENALEESREGQTEFPVTRVIEIGDNLTHLCREVYGKVDERIIQYVISQNENIKGKNLIIKGSAITFPRLPVELAVQQ